MNKAQQLRLIRSLSWFKNYNTHLGLSRLSEDHLQACICQYLETRKILHFSVPNGSHKSKVIRAVFMYTGLISGVPDLVIAEMRGNYGGMYLELKHKYNKPSANQLKLMKQLERNGYYCVVSNDLEKAIASIDQYLNQ